MPCALLPWPRCAVVRGACFAALLHAQAIAYHVTQLRSPEPLQQLQAVTLLLKVSR